jgi:hypothetical protein
VGRRKKIEAARTEALFRSVNDHIAAATDGFVDDAEFVCECADAGCADRIEAPLDDYEEVRTEPKRFLVKPGHADEEIERVLTDEGDYQVVEKDVTPPRI